jgi:hypothetical protein
MKIGTALVVQPAEDTPKIIARIEATGVLPDISMIEGDP